MKIKTFLVDLDGVVVHRADYFSNRAKTLYPEADHDAITDFFVGDTYKKTSLGHIGLVEALSEVLPNWNVGVSVEELLSTWFAEENDIDHGVLDKIQELRTSGIRCVIATDHSQYRKDDVWDNLNMKDYFDGIIASADVGATKEEPEFFEKSMSILSITDPATLLFTDDDPENVEVAKELGIKAIVYT